MQNWLTNATKKRVIREIRKILYDHPRYRQDSENVQNKYSFDERPQRGVIVNSTSADRVRLSADNYVGRLSSFVMQAPVENFPGTTVEWVIENKFLLEQYSRRRDVFPSPPGVYMLEVQSLPDEGHGIPGFFTLDPRLTERDEALITFGNQGQIARANVVPDSVRLWVDGRHPLLAGVDYEVDSAGLVTFLKTLPSGTSIYADYRYSVERQGPFQFRYEEANLDALPGAVIAFGRRAQECDQTAIVVHHTRTEVAEVYGGKFEVHFELVVFSRDAEDREQLSDYVVLGVLERQNALGFEGLELLDVSPGGESEEVYSPELDDYYYDGAVSIGFRVDWEIYRPMPANIFRVTQSSKAEEQAHGLLSGDATSDLLKATDNPLDVAGVALVLGKDITYERIR